MNVSEARTDLESALSTVPGTRAFGPGDVVDPPGYTVSAPTLAFQSACDYPTDAEFTVFVFVPFSERAIEQLLELSIAAAAAIDAKTDAVVLEATPGVFRAGTTEIPTYELVVSYALNP